MAARKGESQISVARRLGVSNGTVARWLNGSRGSGQKNIDELKSYMGILGIDAAPFFGPAEQHSGRDESPDKDTQAMLRQEIDGLRQQLMRMESLYNKELAENAELQLECRALQKEVDAITRELLKAKDDIILLYKERSQIGRRYELEPDVKFNQTEVKESTAAYSPQSNLVHEDSAEYGSKNYK